MRLTVKRSGLLKRPDRQNIIADSVAVSGKLLAAFLYPGNTDFWETLEVSGMPVISADTNLKIVNEQAEYDLERTACL
jgi:hypothetical protein